jgi:hypothetical protein
MDCGASDASCAALLDAHRRRARAWVSPDAPASPARELASRDVPAVQPRELISRVAQGRGLNSRGEIRVDRRRLCGDGADVCGPQRSQRFGRGLPARHRASVDWR